MGAARIYTQGISSTRSKTRAGEKVNSLSIHDLIFAVGAAVLLGAMLPAVRKRAQVPLSTCVVTGGVLALFVANYVSMRYWYAATVEFGNVLCWAWLTRLAIKRGRR